MPSQIEEIAVYDDGDKVWRTTCNCMGDDVLTFTVATDDEYPEVYLEVYMDCSDNYRRWDEPKWSRPFRSFLERIKVACRVIFTGNIQVSGAFMFRGEKHIDEFCDTIQTHKSFLLERRKNSNYKDINLSGKGDINGRENNK